MDGKSPGGVPHPADEGGARGRRVAGGLPMLFGKTLSEPTADFGFRLGGQQQQLPRVRFVRNGRRSKTLEQCELGGSGRLVQGSAKATPLRLSLPVHGKTIAEHGADAGPWSPTWPSSLFDMMGASPMRSRGSGLGSQDTYQSRRCSGCLFGRRRASSGSSSSGDLSALPAFASTPTSSLKRRRREVSFRVVTMVVITAAVLLCCVATGTIFAHEQWNTETKNIVGGPCNISIASQREVTQSLSHTDVTNTRFAMLLRSIRALVIQNVKDPPKQAVDAVWTSMQTWRRFGAPWGSRDTSLTREHLAQRCFRELVTQWTERTWLADSLSPSDPNWVPHADWIYVAWDTEQFTGVHVDYDNLYSKPGKSELVFMMDMGDGWSPGNATGVPGPRFSWNLTPTGRRNQLERPTSQVLEYRPTARPYYTVQAKFHDDAAASPAGTSGTRARRAFSRLYWFANSSVTGLAWTAPIAYCGNYSCFEGVIASDITLGYISTYFDQEWSKLQRLLAGDEFANTLIGPDNSTVFLVNARSPFQEQMGMLISASHRNSKDLKPHLINVTDAHQRIIRVTARAVLAKYSTWDNQSLFLIDEEHGDPQLFTFHPHVLEISNWTIVEECQDSAFSLGGTSNRECWHVGTFPIELDDDTTWLVVAVLPYGVFSKTAEAIDANTSTKMDSYRKKEEENHALWLRLGVGTSVGMAIFSLGVGFFIGYLVVRPLRSLGRLMRRLADLDFAHQNPAFEELRSGRRSRIDEVRELQESFCRVSAGIEAFSKFVPNKVVRSSVRGCRIGTGIYVEPRVVTIMFSDLRDSTTLSEALPQKVLHRVLTRYFSVMTRIIDRYDGVVAEIQGDGLLVFFNAPQDVESHAEKAVCSALAQQQGLTLINEEFKQQFDIPKLQVRIGVHTGAVLSGNIGSETKMKFGCLGDAVEIAGTFENMCKRYDVDIICSEPTYKMLPEDGFVCRRLDLVKAKESVEAMSIYEVIGKQDPVSAAVMKAHSLRGSPCSPQGTPGTPSVLSLSRWSRRHRQTSSGSSQQAGQPPTPTEGTHMGFSAVDAAKDAAAGEWEEVLDQEDDVELGRAPAPEQLPTPKQAGGGDTHLAQGRQRWFTKGREEIPTLATQPSAPAASASLQSASTCASFASVDAAGTSGAASGAASGDRLGEGQPRKQRSGSLELRDPVSPERCECALLYVDALTAFQEGRFQETCLLAEALLDLAGGQEKAATILLERARHYEAAGLSEAELARWTGVLDLVEE